jgi:hypothetical protein
LCWWCNKELPKDDLLKHRETEGKEAKNGLCADAHFTLAVLYPSSYKPTTGSLLRTLSKSINQHLRSFPLPLRWARGLPRDIRMSLTIPQIRHSHPQQRGLAPSRNRLMKNMPKKTYVYGGVLLILTLTIRMLLSRRTQAETELKAIAWLLREGRKPFYGADYSSDSRKRSPHQCRRRCAAPDRHVRGGLRKKRRLRLISGRFGLVPVSGQRVACALSYDRQPEGPGERGVALPRVMQGGLEPVHGQRRACRDSLQGRH